MKNIFRNRRHRNAHTHEEQNKGKEDAAFFSKGEEQSKASPFFDAKPSVPAVQTKLKVGLPNDPMEHEADAVADKVVNQPANSAAVQTKESEGIQRATLATPMEDEKLSTAEGRMEKDKLIQEKSMDEEPVQKKEEEEAVQKMDEEEPVQKKEEEEAVQKMDEEEPVQKKEEEEAVQKMDEEEPVQKKEEEEAVQKMDEEEPVQKKEEEEVQTKHTGDGASQASSGLSQQIKSKSGSGRKLSNDTKAQMESGIGADFSDVNIHTDRESAEMNQSLNAQAFTHGKDVYFNEGKYSPETSEGKRLLAHELTHVVQQGAGAEIKRMASARFSGEKKFENIENGTATLSKGDRGNLVTKMQQALRDVGGILPKYGVDGIFGSETETAVKKFQNLKTIGETGKLDQATFKQLDTLFASRQPYLDRADRAVGVKGLRNLSKADKAAVNDAMVPPKGVAGIPPKFTEKLVGKGEYGPRMKKHLKKITKSLHKKLFASKKGLRKDPGKNFHAWSVLESTALASKETTDAVYGSYAQKPPMTQAGGNFVDQWEDELVRNAALNPAEQKSKAVDGVWYLINSNCRTINNEHGATPSNTKEKAILDPIVAGLVNTKAKIQKMLEIDVGWKGAEMEGTVYLQRFKKKTDLANRKQLWKLYHTCIHEYIHTLAHKEYTKYADGLDSTRRNTLVEGFADFFAMNVRKTIKVDKALRAQVEGPYFDPKNKLPISPKIGVYPSNEEAERVVSIIGISNAQEAFFRGKTKYIGK